MQARRIEINSKLIDISVSFYVNGLFVSISENAKFGSFFRTNLMEIIPDDLPDISVKNILGVSKNEKLEIIASLIGTQVWNQLVKIKKTNYQHVILALSLKETIERRESLKEILANLLPPEK